MFGDKILEQNLINKCLFLTFLAFNALSIWLSTKGDFLRAKFILQKVSSKNMPYREIPVDKILIINLDRRPLRYAKTVAELTKAGLTLGQYQKFSAVDGQHFSKEVIVELMKGNFKNWTRNSLKNNTSYHSSLFSIINNFFYNKRWSNCSNWPKLWKQAV